MFPISRLRRLDSERYGDTIPAWCFRNDFNTQFSVCQRGGLYHWVEDPTITAERRSHRTNRLTRRQIANRFRRYAGRALNPRTLDLSRNVSSFLHVEETQGAESTDYSQECRVDRRRRIADIEDAIRRVYTECTSFMSGGDELIRRNRVFGGVGNIRSSASVAQALAAVGDISRLQQLQARATDQLERRRLATLQRLVERRRREIRGAEEAVRGLWRRLCQERELACCRGARCRFGHPIESTSFLLNIRRNPRTLMDEDRSPTASPAPPLPPGPIYAFPLIIRPDPEADPAFDMSSEENTRPRIIIEFQFEDLDGPDAHWIASAAPGLGSERTCTSDTFPELDELVVTLYPTPDAAMPNIRRGATIPLQMYLERPEVNRHLREAVRDRYNALRSRMANSHGMRWITTDEARWALYSYAARPRYDDTFDWSFPSAPPPTSVNSRRERVPSSQAESASADLLNYSALFGRGTALPPIPDDDSVQEREEGEGDGEPQEDEDEDEEDGEDVDEEDEDEEGEEEADEEGDEEEEDDEGDEDEEEGERKSLAGSPLEIPWRASRPIGTASVHFSQGQTQEEPQEQAQEQPQQLPDRSRHRGMDGMG